MVKPHDFERRFAIPSFNTSTSNSTRTKHKSSLSNGKHRSMSRSRSPSRARSTIAAEELLPLAVELKKADYFLGTSLLILVVLLWVSVSLSSKESAGSACVDSCLHYGLVFVSHVWLVSISPAGHFLITSKRGIQQGSQRARPKEEEMLEGIGG